MGGSVEVAVTRSSTEGSHVTGVRVKLGVDPEGILFSNPLNGLPAGGACCVVGGVILFAADTRVVGAT